MGGRRGTDMMDCAIFKTEGGVINYVLIMLYAWLVVTLIRRKSGRARHRFIYVHTQYLRENRTSSVCGLNPSEILFCRLLLTMACLLVNQVRKHICKRWEQERVSWHFLG
jgi:hypothetical protein